MIFVVISYVRMFVKIVNPRAPKRVFGSHAAMTGGITVSPGSLARLSVIEPRRKYAAQRDKQIASPRTKLRFPKFTTNGTPRRSRMKWLSGKAKRWWSLTRRCCWSGNWRCGWTRSR